MGPVKSKGLILVVLVMVVVGLCFQAYGAQKSAKDYIAQGKEFLKSEQRDQAITSFTKALKLNPKSIEALNNRGIAYCVLGELDKAIADFSQIILIDPKFGKAYNNRAVAFWKKGELDKAAADIKQAEGLGIKVDREAWAPVYGSTEPPGKGSSSQETQPNRLQEAEKQAPPSIKTYTLKEKQEYQKKIASDLAEMQKEIDQLITKWHAAPPVKKRLVRRDIVSLQQKAIRARNKLSALEKASDKDWSSLKADLDYTMEVLIKAYAEITSRPYL